MVTRSRLSEGKKKKVGQCAEIAFHKAPNISGSLPKFTCPLEALFGEQNMGFQVKFIEAQLFLHSLKAFILNPSGMYCHCREYYRS